MREKFEKLTDSQYEVMAEFLPVQRKRKNDLRDVIDSIRWLNETASQWRNLPDSFPCWDAVGFVARINIILPNCIFPNNIKQIAFL